MESTALASLSGPDGERASVSPADAALARRELALLLALAYSGELGATWAYLGHSRALRGRAEREEVARIARDEIRHRHRLLSMLRELGTGPDLRRERKLARVGHAIALFCRFGGWFFPMYGAAKLEAQNIREYEHAARLAHQAGLDHLVAPLLELAEVEWDHELYFRGRAASHPLWRFVPHWPLPPPREAIRGSFEAFRAAGGGEVERVRVPLLVR